MQRPVGRWTLLSRLIVLAWRRLRDAPGKNEAPTPLATSNAHPEVVMAPPQSQPEAQ
jgi:hypothetical protein